MPSVCKYSAYCTSGGKTWKSLYSRQFSYRRRQLKSLVPAVQYISFQIIPYNLPHNLLSIQRENLILLCFSSFFIFETGTIIQFWGIPPSDHSRTNCKPSIGIIEVYNRLSFPISLKLYRVTQNSVCIDVLYAIKIPISQSASLTVRKLQS